MRGWTASGRVPLSLSSHATHHAQARANRRHDGDERLYHDFPNIFLFHGLIYDLLFMIYDFQLQVTSNFSDADCADNADFCFNHLSVSSAQSVSKRLWNTIIISLLYAFW